MKKRFIFTILALVIGIISSSLTNNVFAASNSPKSNYEVYLDAEKVTMYNKPNGKKIATIEKWANEENDGGPGIPNTFKVKKFVADKWVQVTHKKTDGKIIKGYVQTKYITPNYLAFDCVIIDSTNGLNLRKSASKNSKKITAIPYGVRVDVVSSPKNGWIKVKYVVNNKSKIGFVSEKYVR